MCIRDRYTQWDYSMAERKVAYSAVRLAEQKEGWSAVSSVVSLAVTRVAQSVVR